MKPLNTAEVYFITFYVVACAFLISIVPVLCLQLDTCIRLRRVFGIRRKASSAFSRHGLCVLVEKPQKLTFIRRLRGIFHARPKPIAATVALGPAEKTKESKPMKGVKISLDTNTDKTKEKKDRALEKKKKNEEIKQKKEKQKAERREQQEAEKRAKEDRKRAKEAKRAAKKTRKNSSREPRSRTRELPESRMARSTTTTQGGEILPHNGQLPTYKPPPILNAPLMAPKPVEPTDAKELAIRRGQLIRAKTDYPTMEDVLSDWEGNTKVDIKK